MPIAIAAADVSALHGFEALKTDDQEHLRTLAHGTLARPASKAKPAKAGYLLASAALPVAATPPTTAKKTKMKATNLPAGADRAVRGKGKKAKRKVVNTEPPELSGAPVGQDSSEGSSKPKKRSRKS